MSANYKEGLIAPLHGLRGLAALTVVIGHYLQSLEFAPSLGVVLFFLLSGYLMGRIYLPKRFSITEIYAYVVARIARIYPLFFCVVVIAGIIAAVRKDIGPYNMTVADVPLHLLFAGDGTTIWTISVEFQFYALFILLWAFWQLGSTGRWLLSAVLVGLLVVGFSGHFTGRIDILRYLHVFGLGVFLSIIQHRVQSYPWMERVAGVALVLSGASYLLLFVVLRQFYDHELVYRDPAAVVICFALIGSAVLAPNSFTGRILSAKILFWLGEISFGVYLLHRPVQLVFERLPVTKDNMWAFFIAATAVTITLATVANEMLEKPARRLIREACMPRKRVSA